MSVEARRSPSLSWGRSLGASALAFVLVAAAAALWLMTRPSPAYTPGGTALSGFDYGFSPGHFTWRVGERVTLTFANDSSGIPGKDHELMVGRGPVAEATAFGPRVVGGFDTDFFAGVDVEVLEAKGLSMLMSGEAQVSGFDMSGMQMEMGHMEHANEFMLLLQPGGRATIRFVVPDKPGEWEFGCFEQSGEHYANGMHGRVTVAGA